MRRGLFGADAPEVAQCLVDYAWTRFEEGAHEKGALEKGEICIREALEIYRKRGITGQPAIEALWVLQKVLSGNRHYPEMEAVAQEALMLAGQAPGVEFPEVASIIHGMAEAKIDQGKFEEAEPLSRKAVEMHRRLRKPGDIEATPARYLQGFRYACWKQHSMVERSSRGNRWQEAKTCWESGHFQSPTVQRA